MHKELIQIVSINLNDDFISYAGTNLIAAFEKELLVPILYSKTCLPYFVLG